MGKKGRLVYNIDPTGALGKGLNFSSSGQSQAFTREI